MSFVNGSAQGRQPLHPKRVVFSNSYGVGNRTTISDSRSGSPRHRLRILLMHLEKIGPSPICGRKMKACLNRNSSQKPTAENGSSVAEFLG
jgi:hypothetical protein